MYDKFKSFVNDDGCFYGVLILLVALSSYGLGRLSTAQYMEKTDAGGVTMTRHAPQAKESLASTSVRYVGSKHGSKYHLLSCPGAAQIKEENKIFFATKAQAQSLGYTPAGNCSGI